MVLARLTMMVMMMMMLLTMLSRPDRGTPFSRRIIAVSLQILGPMDPISLWVHEINLIL